MTLLEIMRHRRSVRMYTGEPVEEEKLQQILQAALLSASGMAFRPWELVVVKDKETLRKLAGCREHGSQMLEGADCAIVVLGNSEKSDIWTEDCSIVMANMYLMASSLGVGCCWIQGRMRKMTEDCTTEDFVRNLLCVPENLKLEAIMSIGMPAEAPAPYELNRLPWEKVHKEKF